MVSSKKLFLVSFLFKLLPPTHLFGMKRRLLIWAGLSIGDQVKITSSTKFLITGDLSIGRESWVGHETLFVGGDAAVCIGSYCDIAPRVVFSTGSHQIERVGNRVAGKGYSSPIKVGDGCWIGLGATILGGATIGDRSIVAAGAVVKGTFPAEVIIAGVPARIISSIHKE
ncbi:acyltransferase [Variovorax sp. LT1R16]|uniref:acyltransferase n=1 Tax=Variovorax sp. LT1R16 TaxID=3443728 RepID=UPI003F449C7C